MEVSVRHTRLPGGRYVAEAGLLSAQAALTDGVWVPISGVVPWSVHVTGISGDTVELRGSIEENKPANSAHGEIVGTSITADGIFNRDSAAYKWVKCRVTNYSAGVISAWFHGVQS